MIAGLRLAVTLLTVVPLRADRVDRATARTAMLAAPLVGLIPGTAAAAALLLADLAGLSRLLGAFLAISAMAAVTRALHLDGLADLADGLGSAKPAEEALAIMKKSDIGPFGVVTLILTLGIQATALATAPTRETAATAALVAAMAGRLALPWACRTGVPSARPSGLGALVAETVRPRAAYAVTAAGLTAAALIGLATGHPIKTALAVAAATVATLAVLTHTRKRLGGITGDVLGALVEIATTTALVVQAAH
ncbi:adenosylcobinamide-GDP ribazoletransferase [Actinomadura atramentaria]|uniref:adenosylcobinamide-GDP ribazoletransferase n=1 Tax=Actinomadura atramentaria TaxID=1990 RepID=UPI00039DBA9A|nr:adenosylcobinamide-GDP ribazoletransferase [Actinomadura atramentaria]